MSHTETTILASTTHKMNTSETDIHQIEDDLNRLIKRKNKNKALTLNNRDSRIIRWHFYALKDFELHVYFILGLIPMGGLAFFLFNYITIINSPVMVPVVLFLVLLMAFMIVYGIPIALNGIIQVVFGPSSEARIKKLLDKNLSNEAKAFVSNEIAIYELKMQNALALKASHPSEYDDALIEALEKDYRTRLIEILLKYKPKE